MTDDPRFAVNVEAAVLREGRYLLVERAEGEDHAAGELSLVGGTVDADAVDGGDTGERGGAAEGILERTVRRELDEEVGVSVADLAYVTSSAFATERGLPVVNVVFLASHAEGEPHPHAPEEVAAVRWLTPGAVLTDGEIPSFTREYVTLADRRRERLGWP